MQCLGTFAALDRYCTASTAFGKVILPGCAFIHLLTSWFILQEHHLKNGYQLLYTPHVAKAEMWKTSGHLDFYAENMFDRIKVRLSSEVCKSLCFGKVASKPTSECKMLVKHSTCSHQLSTAHHASLSIDHTNCLDTVMYPHAVPFCMIHHLAIWSRFYEY